jgi:hypothetical protein
MQECNCQICAVRKICRCSVCRRMFQPFLNENNSTLCTFFVCVKTCLGHGWFMVLFATASRTSFCVSHPSLRITGMETKYGSRWIRTLVSNVRCLFVRTVKLLNALGALRMMGNFFPGSIMTRVRPSLPSLKSRCLARLYANSAVSLLQHGIK